MSFLLRQVRRVLVRTFSRYLQRKSEVFCPRRPPISSWQVGQYSTAHVDEWNRHIIECAQTPWLAFWREGWIGKNLGMPEVMA